MYLSRISRRLNRLLIVPYGIETRGGAEDRRRGALLIVPYGIETAHDGRLLHPAGLLIVPYGIETEINSSTGIRNKTFNRTIWN